MDGGGPYQITMGAYRMAIEVSKDVRFCFITLHNPLLKSAVKFIRQSAVSV